LASNAIPSSCTTRSRAKRLASSTMTVLTPFDPVEKPAKPSRPSIGSAPLTARCSCPAIPGARSSLPATGSSAARPGCSP
jgi:hypothetical protein